MGIRGIGGGIVERDKNKSKLAYLWKYSFDVLLWETVKETKTDFYFRKYYFKLINWKENMLNMNVFLVGIMENNVI